MFMGNDRPVCQGNGCIIDKYPIDKSSTSDTPTNNVNNTTRIGPSHFDWPEHTQLLATKFVEHGYTHFHKNYYSEMYYNFFNADQGRESVEIFYKAGNDNTSNITPYLDKDSMGSLMALLHFGSNSCGHVGAVHGGATATAVDVLSYTAVVLSTNTQCVTANMNVNYRKMIPVNEVVLLHVDVKYSITRKVNSNFYITSLDQNILYAEGSLLFIRPRDWDKEGPSC